ncbi:helix-turn-helix domain-containing protein [Streptomyces sp. TLI_146]|uniref:AraC-like ligand-binding domain-containing protein n=1 Tax=Streptomyces sp. TLI_146 TaxID=1938858 RepID=UPI000C710CE4|nr:helix-turn-helix domain-containing protein [Streptomyces sp. TLI_146]PKV90008.1 AraC-like DNA-binding protein [Streptomyces sp. TLI_146]
MGYREIDTDALPPQDRFDWWREAVEQGVAPTRISSEDPGAFGGRAAFATLGPAQLTTMAFSPLTSDRPAQLVRRSDPETFELTLILEGTMRVTQERSETLLHPGDFAMWTSSRPYSGHAMGNSRGGLSHAVILHLPHRLVPLPRTRIAELLARRMPAHSGMGRILAQYLRSVAEEAPGFDEPTAQRLGTTSIELATGFLAEQIGTQERLPAETRHHLLLAAIDTFINDNLADPGLDVGAIAARHHISVRLVHHLFRGRPETVSATIRHRRLERCRTALADPALRNLTVRAIAARWGFCDAAAFNRAFRTAYGVTPGKHRSAALGYRPLHGQPTAPARQVNDG